MEIKIKQIRENAGLSQEKMAEKMNITQFDELYGMLLGKGLKELKE